MSHLPLDHEKTLSPQQLQLYGALKQKSEQIAAMYLGSVQVFGNITITNRMPMAALGIRELINKLPDVIDVPTENRNHQRLGDFAANLDKQWKALCKNGRWPGSPKKWHGEIDKRLARFLCVVEKFILAKPRINHSHRLSAKALVRKHNFSSVPLPDEIEEIKADEWLKYSQYFNNVAHHKPTDESLFLSYLSHFENCLLNYLVPRTFNTQDEILALIAKGESNA